MNILILGDSWGVPNYCGPPGVGPEFHTEYLLKNLGHTVYNFAINGGSNLESINRAKEFLSQTEIALDWIFWFHTESLRDRHLIDATRSFYIDDVVDRVSRKIYTEFERLRSHTAARSLVIGGQAQLLDSFDTIVNADIVIHDWKSKIFARSLPVVHTICHLDLIDKSSDSLEYKNSLLAKHKILLDLMSASDDFPDNCHPGIRPHRELVELMWHSR